LRWLETILALKVNLKMTKISILLNHMLIKQMNVNRWCFCI